MKKIMIIFLMGLISWSINAQTIVQPNIMVVPYTSEGEDIRTVLSEDENKRIIMTKIKEAFDNRGFSTIDFIARLKAAETEGLMSMDNREDIKSQIIDMSGADIYVEAEMTCTQTPKEGQQKPETRIKIILTAYDVSTGMSLSNKIGEAGPFYTDDVAKLAMKAIDSCADGFLTTMQSKFTEMAEKGRSIMLFIGFEETSSFTMESEIGNQGLLLSDEIELWVDSHAYNNYYHLQGLTSTKMIFDEIRLPLIDETTGGNYTASRFGMDMLKFFRSLGVSISRSMKGNTLYITIR